MYSATSVLSEIEVILTGDTRRYTADMRSDGDRINFTCLSPPHKEKLFTALRGPPNSLMRSSEQLAKVARYPR